MRKNRDLQFHAYDNIDEDKVWETVTKNIPELLDALKEVRESVEIKLSVEDETD